MCWNVEVSAASALVGWVACAYLWWRSTVRKGDAAARDAWYARYLITYTFTQFIDIALWAMQEDTGYRSLDGMRIPGGLVACKEYQFSWTSLPEGHSQWPNFIVTKYVLPLVVLSQYITQNSYPSQYLNGSGAPGWGKLRLCVIAGHAIPAAIMSFCFACTYLVPSQWPVPKDTLHWGGDWGWTWDEVAAGKKLNEYWATQVFSVLSGAHVAFFMYLEMPSRVFNVHLLTLACVIGFQAITEGTVGLGSKWCTYCLVYSAVYCADPLWMPSEEVGKREKSVTSTTVVGRKVNGARRRKDDTQIMGSIM